MEQFDEECDVMQALLRVTNTLRDCLPDKHRVILDLQLNEIKGQMGRWRNSTKKSYTASERQGG
jgi:hypothetical protein